MLRRPDDVIAGLVLAARRSGAREAVVFLKGSFDRPAAALSRAIATARLDGLSVEVRRGDDGYVTGEETAVLEALEAASPGRVPSRLCRPRRAPGSAHARAERGDARARPAALADPRRIEAARQRS